MIAQYLQRDSSSWSLGANKHARFAQALVGERGMGRARVGNNRQGDRKKSFFREGVVRKFALCFATLGVMCDETTSKPTPRCVRPHCLYIAAGKYVG